MAEIFRAPVIARSQPGRAKAPSFDAPNILLSVLVATIPFAPVQLPAPPKPAYVQRQFDPPNLITTLPVVSATPPFIPLEWPRATLPRGKAQAFDPPNPLLAELVLTVPFFEPQWPSATPKRPKAQPFDPPVLIANTLVVTTPFLNSWYNPSPIRVRLRAHWSELPNPSLALLHPAVGLAQPKFGFPPVPEFLSNDQEHRRQIARKVNQLLQAKVNAATDVTLNPGTTTTVLTDARIGYFSAIFPAMPQSANGAAALAAGIWITNQVTGSCTINHASNVATDQTIRFLIIG